MKARVIILAAIFLYSCGTESTPIYELNVTAEPAGAGTVTPEVGEYEEGSEVQITATPNEHWLFMGWQGDVTVTDNPVSVVMDADKSIVGLFTRADYPLTLQIQGEGEVIQEVVQSKSVEYTSESLIELTAIPAEGWDFIGWRGDEVSSENPIQLLMDSSKNLTAVFAEKEMTLSILIEGSGEVTQNVIQGKSLYGRGSVVSLSANPDPGWVFYNWKGDLTGSNNPTTIELDRHKEVSSVFLTEADFVKELSESEFYPSVIIGGNVWSSVIRFTNISRLPITLKRVTVFTWGSPRAEIGDVLSPSESFALSVNFNGYQPPLEEFSTYTAEWEFEFNEESYVLIGSATRTRLKKVKTTYNKEWDLF